MWIHPHRQVYSKHQTRPTSCISVDKCNPFRLPNFMSRPRNLSDSGNKPLDCFSYKDKEGNAETRTVKSWSYVYCRGSDTRPDWHRTSATCSPVIGLFLRVREDSIPALGGNSGSLYYSPIKKAVSALERTASSNERYWSRKAQNSARLTPTGDFHSNNHFNLRNPQHETVLDTELSQHCQMPHFVGHPYETGPGFQLARRLFSTQRLSSPLMSDDRGHIVYIQS